MAKLIFYNHFNRNPRVKLSFVPTDKDDLRPISRTKQDMAEYCSLQSIVNRFPDLSSVEQLAQDFNDEVITVEMADSYTRSVELAQELNSRFDRLPSDIRLEFKNDPSLFYKYIANPDNEEDCVKRGFLLGKEFSSSEQSQNQSPTVDLNPVVPPEKTAGSSDPQNQSAG